MLKIITNQEILDIETADADITKEDLLVDKVAYAQGSRLVGEYEKPTALIVGEDSVPIVECDSEGVAPEITATTNDIRLNKTAITNQGVVTGEKDIPSYETSEGTVGIDPGEALEIYLPLKDKYDYTSLQCIICAFNTTLSDSVAAEKVSINNNVYAVNSATPLSSVGKDDTAKTIKLGITNDGSLPVVIRYFTYKEVE